MYARKTYIYIVGIFLLLFCSCQEKRADRFEREAREYTEKHCPQRLEDGLTVLDSMVFVKDGGAGTLQLYYSLYLTDEERKQVMDKLGDLGDYNLRIVRNSVLFAKHKEAGVSFTYIYHDANKGDKIAEYHFEKKDYE